MVSHRQDGSFINMSLLRLRTALVLPVILLLLLLLPVSVSVPVPVLDLLPIQPLSCTLS
jgi:hypothetical protein